MARIRTIKPEFWQDEDVGELSMMARLAFIGAWNLADDEGLLKWTPAYIKAQLFAYDDVTQEDVKNILGEIEEHGLVFQYKDGKGKCYGWIVNFRHHQRIDKPQPTKNPVPSLQNPQVRQAYADRDGWVCQICGSEISRTAENQHEVLSLDHVKSKACGGSDAPSNVRAVHFGCNASKKDRDDSENVLGMFDEPSPPEGKGKEGNTTARPEDEPECDSDKSKKRDLYPAEFEEAWRHYPRRAGDNPKHRAIKAWNARLKEGHTAEEMIEGVKRYAHWCRATGKEGYETVKQAATFFGPDKGFLEEWGEQKKHRGVVV